MNDDESLMLEGEYNFDVQVCSENGFMCFAELIIRKDRICLEISYESRSDRAPFFGLLMPRITCASYNSHFTLVDLRLEGSIGKAIRDESGQFGFHKRRYLAKMVIRSSQNIHGSNDVVAICIHSKDLVKLTGLTQMHAFLLDNDPITDSDKYEDDLCVDLLNERQVGIFYIDRSGTSFLDLTHARKLTPVFYYKFKAQKPEGTYENIKDMFGFLNFYFGSDWIPEKITLNAQMQMPIHETSVYIRTSDIIPGKFESVKTPALIPISRNLRRDSKFETRIPDNAIRAYWDEPSVKRLVNMYLNFREKEISEDKFLNNFRIVEKIASEEASYFEPDVCARLVSEAKSNINWDGIPVKTKNSFLRRQKEWNKQRHNLESQIQKFINLLPERFIQYIGFDLDVIKSLPKLRNDIAHGNEYDISPTEFYTKSLQCELLALYAIMNRMRIPDKTVSSALHELNLLNRSSLVFESIFDLFDNDGNLVAVEMKPHDSSS